MPVSPALYPAMRMKHVALARAQPRPIDPDVAVAVPVPVTGRPDIASARRGNALELQRRRAEIELHIEGARGQGRRRHGYRAGRTGGNQRTDQYFLHLHVLPPAKTRMASVAWRPCSPA